MTAFPATEPMRTPMPETHSMPTTRDKLFHIMKSLAGTAACGAAYKSWSDDFSRKEVREIWADEESSMREQLGWKFSASDILTLSAVDRKHLGFKTWSEKFPICLIPLWAINYIADGEPIVGIDGERTNKSDKLDLDVRLGCIAYGFLAADRTSTNA